MATLLPKVRAVAGVLVTLLPSISYICKANVASVPLVPLTPNFRVTLALYSRPFFNTVQYIVLLVDV